MVSLSDLAEGDGFYVEYPTVEESEQPGEVKRESKFLLFFAAALFFIVAVAWTDTIRELFNESFFGHCPGYQKTLKKHPDQRAYAKLFWALIITGVGIFFVYLVTTDFMGNHIAKLDWT